MSATRLASATTPDMNRKSRPELGYQSLSDEIAVDDLVVEGTLPAWLQGSLLRNGPALFEGEARGVRHWFDGQAMLHRFTVAEGRVSYANRFLRTRAYRAMREEGQIGFSEFATDPCRSMFKRLMTVFDPGITDNSLVSLTTLGQRHYAMTEAPMAVEFDPRTLETLGYGSKAPGTFATAHPHRDPASGALINVATRFGPRNAYRFFVQEPNGQPQILFTQKVREPAYLHSFAMTDRYIAHTEFPFVVNPIEIPLKGKPFIENFSWEPERGTRVFVWDRHSRERVGIYEAEASWGFHHVGAWEDGRRLVMEFADHGTPAVIDALYLDQVRSAKGGRGDRQPPRLRRISVDLGSGSVENELRSDEPIELPRINGAFYLRRYRFVYGIGGTPDNDQETPDQLVKLDNESGAALTWSEEGCYPGEPIFVQSPDPSEDAGVVLSVVLDSLREQSFLLALDARSFQELGRAYAPHLIPHGIHGEFYPDA
jgi:beta,beta-carotene 9',10'-dioxygenase